MLQGVLLFNLITEPEDVGEIDSISIERQIKKEKDMHRKLGFICSLLLMASVLLSSCQPAAPGAAPEAAPGTTPVTGGEEQPAPATVPEGATGISPGLKNPDTLMVITGAGEQETMDPAYMYDTASSTIALNLYEGLVFFNRESTNEYIPALATEWTQNSDGTEYVFKIRKNVKFHKGGTLEPHDIAYTSARTMLQGRLDGFNTINYETFFGLDLALDLLRILQQPTMGKPHMKN